MVGQWLFLHVRPVGRRSKIDRLCRLKTLCPRCRKMGQSFHGCHWPIPFPLKTMGWLRQLCRRQAR